MIAAVVSAPLDDPPPVLPDRLRALIGPPTRGAQSAFARRHQIKPNYLSMVLKGQRTLSRKVLRRIAAAHGTTVAYLLGESPDLPGHTAGDITALPQKGKAGASDAPTVETRRLASRVADLEARVRRQHEMLNDLLDRIEHASNTLRINDATIRAARDLSPGRRRRHS